MQKEGKARRKRKDPESRDFSCPCGKSYLSYAAAYTHAKNKHEGDKKYMDGIKKPEREQLKRGRPKQKKVKTQTQQNAKLTLIESAILKICEQLEGLYPKTVLEGNEQRNQDDYQRHYQAICDLYLKDLSQFDPSSFQDSEFLTALIKDFNEQIAAKVKFATVVLSTFQGSLNDKTNLWNGRAGINETIASALKQWHSLQQHQYVAHSGSNHQDFDINE